jgi:uncharacterized membrane protein YoaK (UPF0700 family)
MMSATPTPTESPRETSAKVTARATSASPTGGSKSRTLVRWNPGTAQVLLLLTVTTGLVDAVSYLGMGHVLVANMTGNVVFLGFALAGVKEFSIASLTVALGSFLVGAAAGGRLGVALSGNRRRWLIAAAATQTILAATAAVATAVGALSTVGHGRLGVIALLGVAMGMQNATVRRLALPDLTTTVLTMTLTGLAADSPLAGGANPRPGRRLASVAAMLAGAAAGGALMLHSGAATTLGVFAGVLAAVTAGFALTTPRLPRNSRNSKGDQ